MKKVLAFMLAMVLVLSLTACSGGEKATVTTAETQNSETSTDSLIPKVALGETVSTDIVDFTLKKLLSLIMLARLMIKHMPNL